MLTDSYTRKDMNLDFFKTWNKDMAYILGFIMADGCIRHKDYCNTEGYSICINLQLKDREILDFIKNTIKVSSNVYIRKWVGSDGIYREQGQLIITSKEIVKDIMALGVIPRKTGKETFPDMPNIFERDFIRGYFDGDGCIMLSKYKKQVIRMFKLTCANKDFLEVCKNKISIIRNNVRYHGSNCFILETRCKNDMISVRDYLYYDDKIFSLRRKKEKFFSI